MAYVTTTEVKQYLGVNFTGSLDTFVGMVISGVTKYVEKYCGDDRFGKRVFQAPDPDTDEVRRFDGNGDKRVYVGDLFSATSVVVDNEEYVEDEDFFLYPLDNTSVNEEAFEYVELAQPETRLNSNSRVGSMSPYIFEKGQGNIEITGKWYFTSAVPDDVKIAVLKLVGGVIKENISDTDVREKKSESLGDYSVSYQDISRIAHALGVNDILSQYKRKPSKSSAGVIKVS